MHQERVFYDDPTRYLEHRFPASVDPSFPASPLPASKPGDGLTTEWEHTWPSHLAFFGALMDQDQGVRHLLQKRGYDKTWSSGNGWEEDERRRGGIQVWAWSLPQQGAFQS